MELTTARLILRPVRNEDLDALFRIESDPDYSFFARPGPVTREHLARQLVLPTAAWSRKPTFSVLFQQEIAGHLVLEIDRGDATAMLGYGIAREHWGKGLATEAARAAVAYAFGTLLLAKVWARVDPRNVASLRVLEKVGFSREGLLRSHVVRRGERCDRAYYGILRAEWIEGGNV
jgi:RimJ/RimL family protein N-acetyltransferase